MNESSIHINPLSPIACWKLNIFSGFLVCVMIISVVFNSLLLLIFSKNKTLITPFNIYVISLTIANLIGSFFHMPFIILSTYMCRWTLGKPSIEVSGFIMYTIGMLQIYLMTVMSCEKYRVMKNPLSIRPTFKRSINVVLVCCFMALFWSLIPFFGWSHYSLDSSLVSSSVEWQERKTTVISYNVTIFTMCYFIPILLAVYCNIEMIEIMKEDSFKLSDGIGIKRLKLTESLNNERLKLIVYISFYAISWTPYGVISIISAFYDDTNKISPLVTLLACVFAKTSMFWSTIYLIFSLDSFALKSILKNFKPNTSTNVANQIELETLKNQS